jgi:chemotaxis protein CheX
MSTATLALEPADLKSLVDEIWSSLLAPPPVDADLSAYVGEAMAGYVKISGGWDGHVVVETSRDGAVAIASTLFDAPEHDLGPADLDDAVGELANIVGGSVKSCVEGHSTLSLPWVVTSEETVRPSGCTLTVMQVWLDSHPLIVRVESVPGDSMALDDRRSA